GEQQQQPVAMAEQTEKAFLKQPKVFLSSKKTGKGKRPGKGGNRFWKNIGLGFKTPRDAIDGHYIDKKCPFTGTVSVRGRILAGTCHSAKMQRTIIVRRNYLHFVKKYQRYEKRHSNIPAHVSPCFRVKEGHYIDKKCPFTGTVSVRGRILAGTCHSAKMQRTIIVRRNYLHFVKKYQRYEKRHSNIPAHVSPCFRVKEGDHVIIGQCRPLSKTVRFNVLKVIPAGASAFAKKAFTGM
ncbi:hypothetical protein F2Q69_00056478, partial [Brassica cretica]